MTVFRPLLLSGKNRQPRSKSTCSHRKCRISRRRQPVKRSRRSAATADGATLVKRLAFGTCLAAGLVSSTVHGMPVVSASRIALPSRSSSSPVRNRSRRLSLNLSIPRAGLVPSRTTSGPRRRTYCRPQQAHD